MSDAVAAALAAALAGADAETHEYAASVAAGVLEDAAPGAAAAHTASELAEALGPILEDAGLSGDDNPADIVTKLKFLFIVVILLFGAMHIGAIIAFRQDADQRRRLLAKLQLPDAGFQVTKTGAWIWRFHLEPPEQNLDALSGSGVVLAARLGLPFARLRASIPDELMATTLANAMGRKRGLSVAALDEDVVMQAQMMRRLSVLGGTSKKILARSSSTSRSSFPRLSSSPQSVLTRVSSSPQLARSSSSQRFPRDSDAGSDSGYYDAVREAERVAQLVAEREQLECLVGTALVLSFFQVTQLVPVVRLAQLISAAKAHFEDVKTPAGWSFEKTQVDFVTLLSPGILNGRTRWLVRARMWKLMMAQSTEGYWDPTSTVAFSLCARAGAETASLDRSLREKLRDFLGSLTEAFEEADNEGDGDITDTLEQFMSEQHDNLHGNDALVAQLAAASEAVANDDPLECNAAAIVASMPPRLVRVAMQDNSINAARVWTTLCCMCMLQELPFGWIWGDGDLYPETERTIVDAAREWVEKYAEERPALKEALADDKVRRRAKSFTRLWVRAFQERVRELRASPAIVAQRNLSQTHRVATEMMRALVMRHDTFAVFLSEPLDGLQRWQMAMTIMSIVVSQLLTNIWMFYAKGVNCCVALRQILDSGPDGGNCPPVGPCRGFEGTCGDITNQFAELPVLPDYQDGMQDWTCTAFPDDNSNLDTFLVGLIALAIAMPVTMFISTCFEIANDNEAPESWLEWLGWRKMVFGRRAHRRWHYTGPKGQPIRYVRWFLRSAGAPISETAANLCRSFYAWVTGTEVPWLVEAREAEEETAAEAEGSGGEEGSCGHSSHGGELASISGGSTSSSVRSAKGLRAWKHSVLAAGLAGVYITWTLFAWFIFTYGMLVYNLLGSDAQNSFATSWGISYAMGAVTEWQDIVTEALKGLVVLVVMERLLLTSDASWMEDHVDYLCLQALLFKHSSLTMTQQVRLLFARSKRLQD